MNRIRWKNGRIREVKEAKRRNAGGNFDNMNKKTVVEAI
jgi:hypothetical protein